MRSHLLHDLFTIVMFAVVGSKAAITTAGCSGNSSLAYYHLDDNSFPRRRRPVQQRYCNLLYRRYRRTWLFLSTCRLARGDNDHTAEVCSSSPTYDWERYLRSYRLLYLGF
ncbi:hypothetical protein BKA62DRAFT_694626 [Auriculariales sp. MPI-PUGE-AT-0066]|nr:hypothetical protein BKA62DRAFT_694626 [Auriculariales sp. MPI-PUGE-AT-0066]